LLPLWNAYSFFVTYANVDGWLPEDCSPPTENYQELDSWIISLLNDVITQVRVEMDGYNLYKVVPVLVDYIDNLTNWYIRRSRRRFWKSENDTDKNAAYATLYYVLVTFSRVIAPFLPFISDCIYRNLTTPLPEDLKKTSVHLTEYPDAARIHHDEATIKKMAKIRRIVAMGHSLRSRFLLKNRQPLSKVTIILRDEALMALLHYSKPLIAEELNVKDVVFHDNEESVVTRSVKANFKRLGKRFGPKMKEAAAIIERFTPQQLTQLENGAALPALGEDVTIEDVEIRRTKHEGIEVETLEGITVALDTVLTQELIDECSAREFVNRIQTVRKNRDFNVADRIEIRCSCPEALQRALGHFGEYIRNETLAVSLDWAITSDGGSVETIEINGTMADLQVRKN